MKKSVLQSRPVTIDGHVACDVLVYGKVQGIGLRARVLAAALAGGVGGWICNSTRKDKVQLRLEGKSRDVAGILAGLQAGSYGGSIGKTLSTAAEPEGFETFSIVQSAPAQSTRDEIRSLRARMDALRAELRDMNSTITRMGKTVGKSNREPFISLVKLIPSEFLGEPLARSRHGRDVARGAQSFTAECWSNTAIRQTLKSKVGFAHENLVDVKINGQEFARSIGLRTPGIYQHGVRFSEISVRPGIVIKPVSGAGSRGVFSIRALDDIYSLGDAEKIDSPESLRVAAADYIEKAGKPDLWMVEELILDEEGGLPNDIKLLTFYGEVAMVQEATRMPTRVCYYDRAGERIRTGRYEYMQFDGTGVPPEYFALAEEVSLKVPVPFLRIDFLKSANGPVFGEFTPRPGNFHQFNVETDRLLGRHFVEARGRLFQDLYAGKKFPEFDQLIEKFGKKK